MYIGADKHRVEVTGSDHTLGQLQQTLQDLTEVPVTAQKIIFKGIIASYIHHCGEAGII